MSKTSPTRRKHYRAAKRNVEHREKNKKCIKVNLTKPQKIAAVTAGTVAAIGFADVAVHVGRVIVKVVKGISRK
jgi:hypothetical protein